MDTANKIEKYLLGQMTESERTSFETELENNPMLKEQLEMEQAIVGQIRNRAFVDKQIITAKIEMQKGKTIRLISYSVGSIAALLLVFFFVKGVWQGQNYDKLYASNFTAYTNDLLTIDGSFRGDAEIDTLQVAAMVAYEKKDFTSAETELNQILLVNDNPDLRFYLAITQLETGKTKAALENLQMLYSQPKEYRYYEQTRWYLALVQLKLHDKGDAKKYLDELVALDGVYLNKAKELLKKF